MRSPVKAIFCSKLAIATALVVGATPVAAQTLQGTIDSSTGIGAIAFAPGGTSINVTSSQAVINWTATGPSSGGNTTFQSWSGCDSVSGGGLTCTVAMNAGPKTKTANPLSQ